MAGHESPQPLKGSWEKFFTILINPMFEEYYYYYKHCSSNIFPDVSSVCIGNFIGCNYLHNEKKVT